MRTVSFVEHFQLKVKGKVNHQCMMLADVDGDGNNELVMADEDGNLSFFKGDAAEPWWSMSRMGDVSCISSGDVCNKGKNCVLVFAPDGGVAILELSNHESTVTCEVKHERTEANVCSAIVGDVDQDQKHELVVCHSNCRVSAYRWDEKKKELGFLQLWKLKAFAGNVTLHTGSNLNLPCLMVSQPGCSYAVLRINWTNVESQLRDQEDSDSNSGHEFVEYTPLSSRTRLQNPTITCQIIGDIKKVNSRKEAGYFALCTLDGTIKLMEDDTILWSVQVDHQLFAVDKMDVLGDDREEVIVCAWDGQTYIVDHDRNVVRYQFHDNVQAFCAGTYSAGGKHNSPCLVYADFHGCVWVYYDVTLPYLHTPDLLTAADHDPDICAMFAQLNVTTPQEKRELLRYCLHGMPARRLLRAIVDQHRDVTPAVDDVTADDVIVEDDEAKGD